MTPFPPPAASEIPAESPPDVRSFPAIRPRLIRPSPQSPAPQHFLPKDPAPHPRPFATPSHAVPHLFPSQKFLTHRTLSPPQSPSIRWVPRPSPPRSAPQSAPKAPCAPHSPAD